MYGQKNDAVVNVSYLNFCWLTTEAVKPEKGIWASIMKKREILTKIALLLALSALIFGCSPGRVALTAYENRVEAVLPVVEIDRYEPVVFPAGRLE